MWRNGSSAFIKFLILPVAFVLAFLGPVASANEVLKVGVVGPLSGGAAWWGIATQRAVEMASEEVNRAGGLQVGDKTYSVESIVYDTGYTGEGGTTAARRLVFRDGVQFVFGPMGSPPVLGVLNVTEPEQVLSIGLGFSPRILVPQHEYHFRPAVTTNEFAPPIARWMRETYPDAKRVGFISPSDEVGQEVVPVIVRAYEAEGFEVVFNEHYERGATDFASLITRLITRNVDILDLNSNPPLETGLLIRQARQLGYRGIIMQTGGPEIGQVIEVAGPLAEGFLSFDVFDRSDPTMASFVEAYQAKYNEEPSVYTPIWYNAAQILFEAMRRAGSLDTTAVRDALLDLEGYETIFGPVRWTGQETYGINHQLLVDFFISEVRDGKPVQIARVRP